MVAVGPVTVLADRRPRPRCLAAIAVGAVGAMVGLVACGSDDDDAGGNSTDTTEVAEVTSSTTETTSTADVTTTAPVVVSTPVIANSPGYSAESADGPLRQGVSGPRVYLLQSQLVALGYDAGPLDGLFGSKTRDAVVSFQRDKTLATDGVVGPQTAAALSAACEPVPACPKG
jgi:Putative peptidoglycan binding domain